MLVVGRGACAGRLQRGARKVRGGQQREWGWTARTGGHTPVVYPTCCTQGARWTVRKESSLFSFFFTLLVFSAFFPLFYFYYFFLPFALLHLILLPYTLTILTILTTLSSPLDISRSHYSLLLSIFNSTILLINYQPLSRS